MAKMWIGGDLVELKRPARLEADLETGRWKVVAEPVDHPLEREWRVAAELDAASWSGARACWPGLQMIPMFSSRESAGPVQN